MEKLMGDYCPFCLKPRNKCECIKKQFENDKQVKDKFIGENNKLIDERIKEKLSL